MANDEEDYYCMTKGSKNPLAAMFETSVMCRPDNLFKNIMILIVATMQVLTCRSDNLVKNIMILIVATMQVQYL